jgi:hypothetical protein
MTKAKKKSFFPAWNCFMMIPVGLATLKQKARMFNTIRAFFASQVQLTAWTSTRIICRRGDAGQCHPEAGRHDSSRRAQQAPARDSRRELGSQREHVTVAQVEHLWTS